MAGEDENNQGGVPPQSQAKIPHFNNPTTELTARQFFATLENVSKSYGWTENQTLGAAVAALRGKARRWYEWASEHGEAGLTGLATFKTLFIKRFSENNTIGEQVKTISNLIQQEDESVIE